MTTYHGGLARKRRRRRARKGQNMVLGMAAMIDITFLLLMYFLLTADFAKSQRQLTLQQAGEAETSTDPFALPIQPILLAVQSTGPGENDYRLRVDAPGLAALLATGLTLEQALEGASLAQEQVFVITPAPDARWEHALRTLAEVRSAGFDRVSLESPQ